MRWIVAASLFAISCTAWADGKDNDAYTVDAATHPAAVSTSADAAFAITINPAPPWVLKAETPLKVVLAPSEGVEVENAVLTGKDLDAASRTLTTGLSAKNSGEHSISANMSFFLCKEDICQRFRHELEARFTARD